ncbi:hypothetical protein [Sphingobium sp. YR768]|uniref:hypothetical protein n=1 Tax=Sphingobium sp. YR768 TaxID=1884365 RepID=UPI0008CD2355|nr:hypothetical protein [Sphingobium sp. YR768]SES08318.1 hypothetical protein SAMN05518866_13727 [Sphingobium sp. YR768]
MKTLSDVKSDMSALYEEVRSGTCDLKIAAELANITGKYLKAAQLEFAKELYSERVATEMQKRL